MDLSLAGIDSTTARAHHDAAGKRLDEDVLTALEKVAAEAEKTRSKGAAATDKIGQMTEGVPKREELRLKARRGVARRYDGTPASYLAGHHLRASMIWIKDLT
ncbi:hypothetical protein [Streptomyces klenkii]|uniref:hypothetical protein n=1 Tax=Streptomyces klenkii TaxID=1420899 RepID=UPI003F4CBF4F